ncbi:MAG: ArsR/SmtB family transcription factor [Myxococcaceae bacterium]
MTSTAAAADAVFRAVSDPTRRHLLKRLKKKELSVAELCEPYEMSQPAVSQHLKVLREAGLVEARRDGRQQYYRLRPKPLRHVHEWAAEFEAFWNDKLDALGDYLEKTK